MGSDAVHFLKITGRLASEVEVVCEAIRKRKPTGENLISSHRWPLRDRRRIDHLGEALLSAARPLAVVSYSQFIDGYVYGTAASGGVGWPAALDRTIHSAGLGITWFPSRDWAKVNQVLQRSIRRRQSLTYVRHLQAAMEDIPWVKAPALIVVIAQSIGGSWDDEVVHAAAKVSLRRLLQATPMPEREQIDGRRVAGLHRRLKRIAKLAQQFRP